MGVVLLDVAPIAIGGDCQIGPNVQFLTSADPPRPRVAIGNNVWLGGGVIILPGITIGDNMVVGAGVVVTRSLPANMIAAGNPARIIRTLSRCHARKASDDR